MTTVCLTVKGRLGRLARILDDDPSGPDLKHQTDARQIRCLFRQIRFDLVRLSAEEGRGLKGSDTFDTTTRRTSLPLGLEPSVCHHSPALSRLFAICVKLGENEIMSNHVPAETTPHSVRPCHVLSTLFGPLEGSLNTSVQSCKAWSIPSNA